MVITWLDGSSQPIPWLGSVVTNVTATQPTSSGWITAFPADSATIPWVSSLNFIAGATVPNQVMVRASQQQAGPFAVGSVAFYNPYGYTHLIVDVFGLLTNWSAPAPTPAAVANGILAVTPSVEPLGSASPLR